MSKVAFTRAELVGEKVRLRPIHPGDAESAYPLLEDGVVVRTLTWDGPSSVEDLAESYRQRSERWLTGEPEELELGFRIESLDDGRFLGSGGPRMNHSSGQWEIGYWLGEEYWGQGLMTDAARMIIHFTFEWLDAVRIFAPVYAGNVGSRRVLEKNGFHLDGTLRRHAFKSGEWRDAWFLSLLREEWEANREWYKPVSETVERGDL